MKSIGHISLSVAAFSMVLFLPGTTHAQKNSQDSMNQNSSQAQQEATQMVPARAYLTHKLDAKDLKPGAQFTATLSDSVALKNGQKLPRGTELVGNVVNDNMQLKGNSKLSLRINEAKLKDGSTIPVKTTIVGIYGPASETSQGYTVAPGEQQPNDWTPQMLAIDQLNAVKGVDLHSRVAGQNSGVFVANKKDDVKISAGSELALAIAPERNSQQSGANGGS